MSKKFDFVRAGAITMVLALGTSCFMSGTLAKYVTSANVQGSARVAKFGVKVTANGSTFAEKYETNDKSFTLDTYSVISAAADDDVVAPGTTGNMTSMTLSGKPEVAVRVSYEVTEFELTNWTTNGTDEYCPIVINVNGEKFNGLTATSIDQFETDVIAAINKYSKDYSAGTDLSSVGNDSLKVSWEWPFSTSADNDVKDTALGDRAAANAEDAGKIKLEIKTTVTQID